MTSRGKASAAAEEGRVVPGAYEYPARTGLLLEVAFETEVGVPFDQHPGVHGPMRLMARGASLANGLVLEDKRASLGRVAPAAGIKLRRQAGPPRDHRVALVRIVAIRAAHLAFEDGMMAGKSEPGSHFEMAAEASFGGFIWINDGVMGAAGLVMQAARAMTRFAAHIERRRTLDL
jgi:hypothetical protein